MRLFDKIDFFVILILSAFMTSEVLPLGGAERGHAEVNGGSKRSMALFIYAFPFENLRERFRSCTIGHFENLRERFRSCTIGHFENLNDRFRLYSIRSLRLSKRPISKEVLSQQNSFFRNHSITEIDSYKI